MKLLFRFFLTLVFLLMGVQGDLHADSGYNNTPHRAYHLSQNISAELDVILHPHKHNFQKNTPGKQHEHNRIYAEETEEDNDELKLIKSIPTSDEFLPSTAKVPAQYCYLIKSPQPQLEDLSFINTGRRILFGVFRI